MDRQSVDVADATQQQPNDIGGGPSKYTYLASLSPVVPIAILFAAPKVLLLLFLGYQRLTVRIAADGLLPVLAALYFVYLAAAKVLSVPTHAYLTEVNVATRSISVDRRGVLGLFGSRDAVEFVNVASVVVRSPPSTAGILSRLLSAVCRCGGGKSATMYVAVLLNDEREVILTQSAPAPRAQEVARWLAAVLERCGNESIQVRNESQGSDVPESERLVAASVAAADDDIPSASAVPPPSVARCTVTEYLKTSGRQQPAGIGGGPLVLALRSERPPAGYAVGVVAWVLAASALYLGFFTDDPEQWTTLAAVVGTVAGAFAYVCATFPSLQPLSARIDLENGIISSRVGGILRGPTTRTIPLSSARYFEARVTTPAFGRSFGAFLGLLRYVVLLQGDQGATVGECVPLAAIDVRILREMDETVAFLGGIAKSHAAASQSAAGGGGSSLY